MVCSTELMVGWCKQQTADTIIITTESGMIHRLRKEVPGKTFVAAPTDRCSCNDCRFMKMNTLEKLHDALLNLSPEILIPEPIRARAELPIRRMLQDALDAGYTGVFDLEVVPAAGEAIDEVRREKAREVVALALGHQRAPEMRARPPDGDGDEAAGGHDRRQQLVAGGAAEQQEDFVAVV